MEDSGKLSQYYLGLRVLRGTRQRHLLLLCWDAGSTNTELNASMVPFARMHKHHALKICTWIQGKQLTEHAPGLTPSEKRVSLIVKELSYTPGQENREKYMKDTAQINRSLEGNGKHSVHLFTSSLPLCLHTSSVWVVTLCPLSSSWSQFPRAEDQHHAIWSCSNASHPASVGAGCWSTISDVDWLAELCKWRGLVMYKTNPVHLVLV